MNSGIYAILNIVNEKCYVGSTCRLYVRWRDHLSGLRNNRNNSLLLQRAWNKYGQENFIFVVLEYTDWLVERERFWIKELKTCDPKFGYNILEAANSRFGFIASEETKAKISKALTGIVRSEETKKKIRKARLGTKRSEETKIKIGLSGLGRKAHNRNETNWPHNNGIICKCYECKAKRKMIRHEYYITKGK